MRYSIYPEENKVYKPVSLTLTFESPRELTNFWGAMSRLGKAYGADYNDNTFISMAHSIKKVIDRKVTNGEMIREE